MLKTEQVLDYGFFINHLRSSGPMMLGSGNLPFDRATTNAVSMRSMSLLSLEKHPREEVFLQSVKGNLMLIYSITRKRSRYPETIQFFLLPQGELYVIPNFGEIRPTARKLQEEQDEKIRDMVRSRLHRLDNAKILMRILQHNLLQSSQQIPRINKSLLENRNFPLVLFRLTQLGPTVAYLDDHVDQSLNWRNICMVSMIQSNTNQGYEENINLIPIGVHILLTISLTFRDKQATDKRLRKTSMVQFGFQIKQEYLPYLPNHEQLKEFQRYLKETMDIPIILANKGKRYYHQLHTQLLDLLFDF